MPTPDARKIDLGDDLLTDAEVAKHFKVARSTVRSWVSEGRFQAVKLGRSLRFDPVYVLSRKAIALRGGEFLERVR